MSSALLTEPCREEREEAIQSLAWSTPCEALSSIKRLWAYAALSETPFSEAFHRALPLVFQTPFAKSHPVARACSFLLAKQMKKEAPPLVLMHPILPLFESCQLALLWAIAGEEKSARLLAEKLLSWVELPSLWSREEEFCEEEAALSIALLKGVMGQKSQSISDRRIDLYFYALAKHLPCWEEEGAIACYEVDPERGFSLHRFENFIAALSLAGDRTSLGALRFEEVEVRALGPQKFPLNEADGFGVLRLPDSQPVEKWTAVAAFPEIWMEVIPRFEKGLCQISLRFLGLKPQRLLAFSFYVKAARCEVGEVILQKQSLQRYRGDAKPVILGGKLKIQSLFPGEMEVIPLAGKGCFWDCDYLIAFSLHPFEAMYNFELIFTI